LLGNIYRGSLLKNAVAQEKLGSGIEPLIDFAEFSSPTEFFPFQGSESAVLFSATCKSR